MSVISSKRILSSTFWTRTAVLVLAIAIVASSLTVYSLHTAPIFSLFLNVKAGGSSSSSSSSSRSGISSGDRFSNGANTNAAIMIEMVEDRRLISTLVAAQASVFCPLFLLLTSKSKRATTSAALDLVCCHVLMPFGLALSWIFCILFDRKTMAVVTGIGRHDHWYNYLWPQRDICLLDLRGQWPCIAVNTIHALKYPIVLVLFVEIALVVAGALVRSCSEKRGAIQLAEDDEDEGENEEYKGERYDEESRGKRTEVSYMDPEQCAVLQL
ncbi:hypothetical protein BX666DRAFT_1936933 [Dichotomocladium elegans]|nr:hypothetical protein BX666DRAFT_1936933 [Dichotomocladium elegans]